MTEPPRPPGDPNGSDPTTYNPNAANDPTSGPTPPSYEPPTAPSSYEPPTAPGYDPPQAPGYAPPPSSGAGGYGPPPGPGSYGPPPGPGGFGPQPGFGQPGFGPSPVGYPTADEKTWALIAHFGAIVVGFIAPLVAMLTKGNESPVVRAHAVEALNFQITWGIAHIVAFILTLCTFGILFFLPMITVGIAIVFAIIGGIKANEGTLYRYPLSVRMVN